MACIHNNINTNSYSSSFSAVASADGVEYGVVLVDRKEGEV